MAKLYFKYGAMGSSKTATALITKYNYEERGMKVWLIKPAADQRDGAFTLKSRIGLTAEAESACGEVVFVEIPVFDAFDYDWYAVWIVRSDVVTRVERVKSRDNVTGQNVSDIIARQSEPNVDAAVVIRNDGTLDRLKEAVFATLKQSGVTK